MKKEFLQYLQDKKLCTVQSKILLTVSGGIDSMVMLRLFHECGFNISVAHVNFKLRGSESDGDEMFVSDLCQKLSIPFFTTHFETGKYAEEKSLSTQMAGRELRYAWFEELATKHHFDFVATAHHLNDSIETALLNFARGSGLEGLDGIAPKNGKIIRPLLFASREQIELYAKENKIEWREDRSNATDDYQRNFIRHKVIPLLKEINPSLEGSFSHSIEKISGAIELQALGFEHWRRKYESTRGAQVSFLKEGFDESENPAGLLWNLIKSFGFNLDQCTQIAKAMYGQPGKKFYSHQFELIIDREDLIVKRIETAYSETLIREDQTQATLGKLVLEISRVQKAQPSKESSNAFLDADKLQFPLKWRRWKAGDHFHPLGMSHKKKLSDFFIDQKISSAEKESITVLESGDEIAWVVGYRISDHFKLIESTKKVVRFELTTF